MTRSLRPLAHAVVEGGQQRFYAETAEVLDRVIALELIAQLPSDGVSSEVTLQHMKSALKEEQWADALVAWMDETGKRVDVFPEPPDVWDPEIKVWTNEELATETVLERLGGTPLFVQLPGSPASGAE